jgi:hypothetical protein
MRRGLTPFLVLVLVAGIGRVGTLFAASSQRHSDREHGHSHVHGHWHGDEYHVHHHHHDEVPSEPADEHEKQPHEHGLSDNLPKDSPSSGMPFVIVRRAEQAAAKSMPYLMAVQLWSDRDAGLRPATPPPRLRAGRAFCREPVDRLRTVILQV